jgi:hypothetical protein
MTKTSNDCGSNEGVVEASHSGTEHVDFCSDAGRGYKSAQTILGLRYAKVAPGIRARKLHFKASGEGKCSETGRHNMDIRSRRASAMRAGEPAASFTPSAFWTTMYSVYHR